MNKIQKEIIRYLRGEGLGYKAIATRMDITENTVKGFCKRNGFGGVATTNTDDSCRQCGATLERKPGSGQKKFCSDKCRNTWWNRHAFLRGPSEKYRRICACCGCIFYNQLKRSKYCGHPCYIIARYGKQENEAISQLEGGRS